MDTNSLIDISLIDVDKSLPTQMRIEAFLKCVKNPYCFKVGDTVVKVSFNNNAPKIQQSLENLAKELL